MGELNDLLTRLGFQREVLPAVYFAMLCFAAAFVQWLIENENNRWRF